MQAFLGTDACLRVLRRFSLILDGLFYFDLRRSERLESAFQLWTLDVMSEVDVVVMTWR
jgi:hypothetical protein